MKLPEGFLALGREGEGLAKCVNTLSIGSLCDILYHNYTINLHAAVIQFFYFLFVCLFVCFGSRRVGLEGFTSCRL